jgi:outer membrane protein TolC
MKGASHGLPWRAGLGLPLLAALGSWLGLHSTAIAQQPLSDFLRSVREGGALDVREASIERDGAGSRVDERRARLLPSLGASASYTRNQYAAVAQFPTGSSPSGAPILGQAIITPEDALDARFTLTVPLLDVSAWSSFFAAEDSAQAATERLADRVRTVEASVITKYYAHVASRAVLSAAERTLTSADENLAYIRARYEAGLASELDEVRAHADRERAAQKVADAELEVALSARALFVASGLEPEGTPVELGDDALEEEPRLEEWVRVAGELPSVRAARREARAASWAQDSAWQTLLPTISATATERLTNATGFNGQSSIWALGVSAAWQLDFGAPAARASREHDSQLTEVRLARTTMDAQTDVHESWHRVRALLARLRSARVAEEASARGAEVARARYQAGTGTQLEQSQAERDLFEARVARIQAEADLRVARLALRVRAGLPPRIEERP